MKHLYCLAVALIMVNPSGYGDPLDADAFGIEEQYKIGETDPQASWLTVLHLHQPDVRIPLMPEVSPPKAGTAMERQTLRVEWLIPGELLWVTWQIAPSKDHKCAAHLLFDVAEEREILRKCILISAAPDLDSRYKAQVAFTARDRSHVSQHTRHDFSRTGYSQAVPMGVVCANATGVRHVTLIENTEFEFRDKEEVDTLSRGWQLDLAAPPLFDMDIPEYKTKRVTLSELAEFLAELQSDWGALLAPPPLQGAAAGKPTGDPVREDIAAQLLAANPGTETAADLTGLFKIPDALSHQLTLPKCQTEEDTLNWKLPLFMEAQWLYQFAAKPTPQFRLIGTIAEDLPIQMDIQFNGRAISGAYWYDKYRKPITLKGQRTKKWVRLEERDARGTITGTFDGLFVNPCEIRGDWRSPDGKRKLPFAAGIWEKPRGKSAVPGRPARDVEHEIITRETGCDKDGYQTYEYEMKCSGQQETIPLGPFRTRSETDAAGTARAYSEGFDEESYSIRQLTDSLREVTWKTLPYGGGVNANWSTLLLAKRPEGWRIVFADCRIRASYQEGASNRYHETLHFEAHADGSLSLVLERGATIRNHGAFGDAQFTIREEWPLLVDGNTVRVFPGRRFGKIHELARAVSIWKAASDFGEGIEDGAPEEAIARLRTLNPGLRRSNFCSGILLLNEDIEPYKPNPEGVQAYTGHKG